MKSFTLVEILVVVAIITIIILLAVPNILRSRIDSNEFAALANLRSLFNALQMYYANNQSGYPQELSALVSSDSGPSYISQKLAEGSKSGYLFEYTYVDKNTFYINANPESSKTGRRYFYIDETGIIKEDSEGQADENDPPVI
jgi:type II secretory pathway pseudopilin PulG